VIALIGTFIVMMDSDWTLTLLSLAIVPLIRRGDLFLRAAYPSRINLKFQEQKAPSWRKHKRTELD